MQMLPPYENGFSGTTNFVIKYISLSVIFATPLARPPVLRGKYFLGRNVQK
jgi:hypothetical protein